MADVLERDREVLLSFKGSLINIFESSQEIGWVIDLYENADDYINDLDSDDGAMCTGSAVDAVEWFIVYSFGESNEI